MSISFFPSNNCSIPPFVFCLDRRATQVVIDVTYGISVTSPHDPLIVLAERVMSAVSIALSPPMWIINPVSIGKLLIPIVIPSVKPSAVN